MTDQRQQQRDIGAHSPSLLCSAITAPQQSRTVYVPLAIIFWQQQAFFQTKAGYSNEIGLMVNSVAVSMISWRRGGVAKLTMV
jgi:hypothetical protein